MISEKVSGLLQRFIIVLPVMMLLTACSHDMSGLQTKINTIVKETKGHDIKAAPKYVQIEPYIYKATIRDPFVATRPKRPGPINSQNAKRCNGPTKLLNRSRELLESFPLDTLRMVGVVRIKGVMWALLQTKSGTVHRVRAANYIGQNHGKIVGITGSEVLVSEIVENKGIEYEEDECPYRIRKATLALSR